MDIDKLIATISWGSIPAVVSTYDEEIISLVLRPPTPREQAMAVLVYNRELKRGSVMGLLSEQNMLSHLMVLGQWSTEKENEIEGLYKDIQTIRRGLMDFVFNTTRLEHARSLLRRAEKALMERLNKKNRLLQNCREANAELCQQRYLISQITEDECGNKFWSRTEDFDNHPDSALILQLCECYYSESRMLSSDIRRLARSQQWRPYWEVSKSTNDLFDNPVVLWSSNQRELAYWSTIYDSVYSAYERPSKQVINDDDLLDSWFIRQGEKVDSKSNESSVNKPSKPGRNEEFIMADQDGAKRVYNLNDPGSRAKIRARQKVLRQKGSVTEQNMPDSQREMRQQLSTMQKDHVKSINCR